MLSSHQIATIRDQFEIVADDADGFTADFYRRLFDAEPSLRPMFKGDLAEQGRKLATVLTVVVASLDRLGDIVPTVQNLGRRHAGYGVETRHYAIVGAALLDALDARLGDGFTDQARSAWATAYAVLADVMSTAAEQEMAVA